MQLHNRGVELVVELLDAADHVEVVDHAELRKLLREAAQVMGDLLARDHPDEVATAAPPE
ncbi:hypothetical protein [Mesorhizobium sp. CAU 1732]|uniref:hypothetical protein n=1 Tax=Mesorhizobium sp. CAU 1732 TaxID=3140358 RepID=UPI003260B625